MKKHFLLVPLFLTACASAPKVTDYQRECEAQYSDFSNEVRCLKKAISSDDRLNRNELVKYYLLKGQKYSESVESGAMGETDARIEWQALYMTLKEREYQRAAEARAVAAERRAAYEERSRQSSEELRKSLGLDSYSKAIKQLNKKTTTKTNCQMIGSQLNCESREY